MRLSTMLLPTGEFAIVASEVENLPSPEALDGFRTLREDTGATAMLMTSEAVDIENAIVDESAVRREPDRVELKGGEGFYFNGATPAQVEMDETYRLLEEAIGKDTVALLEGGAGVSPAGLVQLTDEQKRALTEERDQRTCEVVTAEEATEIIKLPSETAVPTAFGEQRLRDIPGYAYSPEGPAEREAEAKVQTDPDSDFGVAEEGPDLEVHDEMPADLLTLLGGLTDRVKAGRLDVQEALRRLAGGSE